MFITKVKFIKQLENIPLRLSDAKRVLLTMNRKIRCSIIGSGKCAFGLLQLTIFPEVLTTLPGW